MSLLPILHGDHAGIKDEGSHHKCGLEVSTTTGIKAMGSRAINVELKRVYFHQNKKRRKPKVKIATL